jgi:hypothetical protein
MVEVSLFRSSLCDRADLLEKALREYNASIKGTFNASSGWLTHFKSGKVMSFSRALC